MTSTNHGSPIPPDGNVDHGAYGGVCFASAGPAVMATSSHSG